MTNPADAMRANMEAAAAVGSIGVSLGGVPFNNHHIEYWKSRALKAEAALSAPKTDRDGDSVLVPSAALKWLFGEGQDADGKWFGETEPEIKPGRPIARYWWRSKFRAMLPSAPVKQDSREGE